MSDRVQVKQDPRSENNVFVGGAAPSMFGLRWINPTRLTWHSRPTCPVLMTALRRDGWVASPITLGYGADFYRPCRRCNPSEEATDV